jgi:hypothetical protein
MGRDVKRVTITAEGRDKGKVFELTEFDAVKGEKWGMRCLNGALQAGISLGDVTPMAGLAGVAGLGILSVQAIFKMPWPIAEPLLDEMFECVRIVTPDGTMVRSLVPSDTEEIATRLQLREEVASMHLGFSLAETLGTWMRDLLARISSTTPASPEASASSSRVVRRRGPNSAPPSESETSTT